MYVYLTIQSHWGIWGFQKEILSKDANSFKDYDYESMSVSTSFSRSWSGCFHKKTASPKGTQNVVFLTPKKTADKVELGGLCRQPQRRGAWGLACQGMGGIEIERRLAVKCVCVFVNQRLNKLIDDDILYDYLCDNCALFDSCDTYMKSYEYDDD